MQRIVVCSDVHGFYNEFMEALNKVNFNPGTDLLVSCGDNIDRGPQPQEILDFLLSLPNAVFIKGNHCTLFEELCNRKYPASYDWHNGTAQSVMDLAPNTDNWDEACKIAMEKMRPLLNKMVDYYETEHYVFTHSTLPMLKDLHDATAAEFENCRWGNPFRWATYNGNKTGKTVVFGHYHTSYQWAKDGKCTEFGDDAIFEPYYGKDFIGIDSCVAYTGFCNVIILEDELIDTAQN